MVYDVTNEVRIIKGGGHLETRVKGREFMPVHRSRFQAPRGGKYPFSTLLCLISVLRSCNIRAHLIAFLPAFHSQESFEHIQDWLNEVNRYASEGTCKLLVGNKSDRPDKVVSTERAKVRRSKGK